MRPLSYEVKVNDNIWKRYVDQKITSRKHVCEPEDNAFDMLPSPESSDTSITDSNYSLPADSNILISTKGQTSYLF